MPPRKSQPAEAANEVPVKKASVSSVDVLDKHGAFIRTYSLEIHRENFMTLAETFAKKIGGSVR